jgi:hypothetical protein
MNDDLINSMDVYHRGKCNMSVKYMNLNLLPTQKESGGLTDIYQEQGTIMKVAYAILKNPNNTKLVVKYGRYHHRCKWDGICPNIISYKYKIV